MLPRTAWDKEKPIGYRLPVTGYQDDPIAMAMVAGADQLLSEAAAKATGFYKELDPSTSEHLDYLAALVGMTGAYWDTQWSDPIKRAVLANLTTLQRYRGTAKAIQTAMGIHSIPGDIWTDGSLGLPFRLPATLGSPKLRFYLRMPPTVARGYEVWKEADRTRVAYGAACVTSRVCYDAFYLGLSVLGDPMFRRVPIPVFQDTFEAPNGTGASAARAIAYNPQGLSYTQVPSGVWSIQNKQAVTSAAFSHLTLDPKLPWVDLEASASFGAGQTLYLSVRWKDAATFTTTLFDTAGQVTTLRIVNGMTVSSKTTAAPVPLGLNSLRVKLLGDRLKVYVNGVYIHTFIDASLASGSTGLGLLSGATSVPVKSLRVSR